MANKTYGKRRVWLNTDQSELACIAWEVRCHKYGSDDLDDSISAEFTIRDCSRTVTLDFFCEEKDAKERLKKVDKLLKEVTMFREALISAIGKLR